MDGRCGRFAELISKFSLPHATDAPLVEMAGLQARLQSGLSGITGLLRPKKTGQAPKALRSHLFSPAFRKVIHKFFLN